MAKRKRRENPSTSTLLLLGGAGAAGYFFWLRPKLDEQRGEWNKAAAEVGNPPPRRDFLRDVLELGLSYGEKVQAERARRKAFEDEAKRILNQGSKLDPISQRIATP